MKKILYFALAALTVGLMASCSGAGSASPGKAAKQYMDYVIRGDYDKFVDGIAFEEGSSKEEIEKGKAMMKSLLTEKALPAFDEKGGLKSVEVVSETIAEDGKSAEVVLRQTFGDGSTEEEDTDLVLVDGKWMMKVGK